MVKKLAPNFWLFIVGIVLTLSTLGQVKPEAESKLVTMDIAIMDKYGRTVKDLKADNFKVSEGKDIKPLAFFSTDNEPASVGILIDLSGSMSAQISTIGNALADFIPQVTSKNEYFVLAFGGDSFFLLTDFTDDQKTVIANLKRLNNTRPHGDTKLFDALKVGLEKMDDASHRKKVLIILSDAGENDSKTKSSQIKWLIKESNVLLYNLRPETDSAFYALAENGEKVREMTKLSGGAVLYYDSDDALATILTRIALALNFSYVIGFLPSTANSKDKDEWRKVEVKVQTTNKQFDKQLIVAAREGYYATRK